MTVRLRKLAEGRYSVSRDGTVLGQVWRHEERFWLRRLYVVRGWKVVGVPDSLHRTRKAAVDALVALSSVEPVR